MQHEYSNMVILCHFCNFLLRIKIEKMINDLSDEAEQKYCDSTVSSRQKILQS